MAQSSPTGQPPNTTTSGELGFQHMNLGGRGQHNYLVNNTTKLLPGTHCNLSKPTHVQNRNNNPFLDGDNVGDTSTSFQETVATTR